MRQERNRSETAQGTSFSTAPTRESFGSLPPPGRCFIFELHILNKTAAELKMNRCSALYRACLCLSAFTWMIGCGSSARFAPPGADNSLNTMTPIHHVVIVIGENRSFDNLFATYQPPDHSQTIFNLLSEGIVNTDGSPGPNFQQAAQQQALDTPADEFLLSPRQTGAFTTLPQPSMGLNLLLLPYSLEYGILSEPGLSQ